jgi:hypothetical protein
LAQKGAKQGVSERGCYSFPDANEDSMSEVGILSRNQIPGYAFASTFQKVEIKVEATVEIKVEASERGRIKEHIL